MKKLIKKLLALALVLCTLVAWTPKSYAAERFLYTITTQSGEEYKIIANVSGDNVEIIGAPYSLICESNTGNIISGSSYYNVIAGDYESTYNDRDTGAAYPTAQINERLKNRSKDLTRLFIFYINAQETTDGDMTKASIKFDDNNIISGRGATYNFGSVGTSTYDRILQNVESNVKTNPYAIIPDTNNPTYNSEKITIGNEKIKDWFTDVNLIKLYEKALSKPTWIKKEATIESQVTVDGYSLFVDKSMMDTNGEIYLKVVDSSGSNEEAVFLLAEKQSIGNKYKEATYANGSGRKVSWFDKGIKRGITITTSSTDKNLLLYYMMNSGQRRTLDLYSSGSQIDLTDRTAFVAVRNSDSRSVYVYSITLDESHLQVTNLIGTINLDSIGVDLNTGSLSVSHNLWVLDKTGTKIMVYKENEEDPNTNCYYLDLDKMFVCHTKQGNYFDVAIPVMKGVNGTFDTGFNNTAGTYIAFITSSKTLTKRKDTDPMAAFENAYLDNKVAMELVICQIPQGNTNDGKEFDKKVDINSLTTNTQTAELPPPLSFKEIIKEEDTRQSIGRRTLQSSGSSRITGASANDGLGSNGTVTEADTVTFTEAFLTDTVSIGKNILMILIFCALVAAGFRHALKGSTDPKEREKTKVTLKNIFIGILIFITLSLIVTLVWEYTYKGIDKINTTIATQADQTFVNEDQIAKDSLLLDIIEVILKVINEIEKGLIEIIAKSLTGDKQLSVTSTAWHEASDPSQHDKQAGINYISLIYNVYTPEGAISSMSPYDSLGVEWSRLLSGYNMLMSVAFVVLLFALVVTACQYIMFAGNVKKITAVKQRLIRMFWAVLLLITIPYLVQFMLYIFNYLTAAVPVNWDDPRFIIDIKFDGVLGEIARNLFLTTQCNIYMVFLVRHVMLSVLLVSGPIVVTIWAIYERFRSFPVWFGELFTNIAMQFCYAVGFMVVIFLSYEGQNPVYGLVLVSTSMGLSKFIKESLQGYFQEGAGISEEAIGSSVVKMAFGWAKKAKRGIKKTGKILEAGSKRIDSDQVTKTGAAVTNVSKVLQGDFLHMTTKRDRYRNMQAKAQKDARTEVDENDKRIDISGEKLEDEQKRLEREYDEAINDPSITEAEKEDIENYLSSVKQGTNKVIKTGKGYDEANSLARVTRTLDRENARKHIRDFNKNYEEVQSHTARGKLAQIAGKWNDETEMESLAKVMSQDERETFELGQQALDIKKTQSEEEISAKLEQTQQETVQLLAEMEAMDDIKEKDNKIALAEKSIKTLATIDAKANESRMQAEIYELINKVVAYKTQKMQNVGLKVDEKQIALLEKAMLAKAYNDNNTNEE